MNVVQCFVKDVVIVMHEFYATVVHVMNMYDVVNVNFENYLPEN